MADYYETRHESRDLSYRGDPAADENAMRRSVTRGSHQSQASASTLSWVHANQIHPPPPPPELAHTASSSTPTPHRQSRPLPEPQLYQSRTAFQYAGTQEEEEDYMTAEPYPHPPPPQQLFGYMPGAEHPADEVISIPASPPLGGDLLSPNGHARGGRSFVGGFFSGLKKLPKIVLGGGGGGAKRKLKRKGTFGTEGGDTSTTVTGVTRGNTLPRYLSNPSIGPSNPEFAHRLSMAVANGSLPPESTPAVFSLRTNPAGPQYPIVTVTPASDGIAEEEQADFYDGNTPMDPQSHYFGDSERERERDRDRHLPVNDRATVMVYSTDSQAPTVTQAQIAAPPPPRQATPGPRVSYQAQLPTRNDRENASSMHEPLPAPTPVAAPPQAGILHNQSHHGHGVSSPRARDVTSVSSPDPTSNYTISAVPSFYDPSFASDLTPIEKFFKGLYNLPWVAQERVTVDYRPGNSSRAKAKVKGLGMKKPMASWYRAVMSRSRRGSRDLDLLSNGTSVSSPLTSLGNTLSPLGSPISRRSGRSSTGSGNRAGHSSKPKRHRRHRHRPTSTSTSGVQPFVPQRSASPIVPTMYPYPYAGYPYGYSYGTYPAPMPVPQTVPRGPRAHRRHKNQTKYAYGYTPYQPMAIPPQMNQMGVPAPGQPVYFIAPSPPQSNTGADGVSGQNHQQSQSQPQAQMQMQMNQPWQGQPQAVPVSGPMQISPVIMHFVPNAFNQNVYNQNMISPPLTPQRQTHGNS